MNLRPDTINVKDSTDIYDDYSIHRFYEKDNVIKRGPKGTRIILKDHDTGEEIGNFSNKILISAAQMTACKQFGIDATVDFPTYNEEFGLENTVDSEIIQPNNEPIVCLFGVGNSGCGTLASDVFPVRYTERIEPKDLLPFRYVSPDKDLNDDLRQQYFGRYVDEDGMIRYMFKAFDTEPQLHLRYLDGTQITKDLYYIDSTQAAECYVETRLRINRIDFRDYFERVTGWDNAVINSITLLYAWYDDTIDKYIWYQQILPFSRLNIPNEWLVDLTKGIDIIYQIYY